jgi:hypothetical protein
MSMLYYLKVFRFAVVDEETARALGLKPGEAAERRKSGQAAAMGKEDTGIGGGHYCEMGLEL